MCDHPAVGSTKQAGERVSAESAAEWAAWLAANHTRTTGVWLVTWRIQSGHPSLGYEESVIEALRYGWIDSTGGKVDDDRRELWFAPRKRGSGWARTNKRRIEQLLNDGRMEPAGLRLIDAAKADGSGRCSMTWRLLHRARRPGRRVRFAPDITRQLGRVPALRAPGHPGVIVQAKRPETRARRIEETARLAQQGKRANE